MTTTMTSMTTEDYSIVILFETPNQITVDDCSDKQIEVTLPITSSDEDFLAIAKAALNKDEVLYKIHVYHATEGYEVVEIFNHPTSRS